MLQSVVCQLPVTKIWYHPLVSYYALLNRSYLRKAGQHDPQLMILCPQYPAVANLCVHRTGCSHPHSAGSPSCERLGYVGFVRARLLHLSLRPWKES